MLKHSSRVYCKIITTNVRQRIWIQLTGLSSNFVESSPTPFLFIVSFTPEDISNFLKPVPDSQDNCNLHRKRSFTRKPLLHRKSLHCKEQWVWTGQPWNVYNSQTVHGLFRSYPQLLESRCFRAQPFCGDLKKLLFAMSIQGRSRADGFSCSWQAVRWRLLSTPGNVYALTSQSILAPHIIWSVFIFYLYALQLIFNFDWTTSLFISFSFEMHPWCVKIIRSLLTFLLRTYKYSRFALLDIKR